MSSGVYFWLQEIDFFRHLQTWRKIGICLFLFAFQAGSISFAAIAPIERTSETHFSAFSLENDSIVALEVEEPPGILIEPCDRGANLGGTASFNVDVSGSYPITYQWYKDGELIEGATSNVLLIDEVRTNDAGLYWAAITNRVGGILTREARLTINERPRIIQEPTDQTVVQGGTAVFNILATGSEPLTYQWIKNGVYVSGATTNVLAIENAQTNDHDSYCVVISNPAGEATSQTVKLNIIAPPVITTQLTNTTVYLGATVSFLVDATGTDPLAFQWYKDGTSIDGATNKVLALSNVKQSDEGSYWATITNVAGSVQSAKAQLVVYGRATLHGVVTDALDKHLLADVFVQVGNQTQITGADGSFLFTNLQPSALKADFTANRTNGAAPLMVQFTNASVDGAYSLQAEKADYSLYAYGAIALAAGENKEWDFSLSPKVRGVRLVLNWGSNPLDLDAHLLTPKIGDNSYHIQYSSRYFGKTNQPPYAQLDIDATSGFGPETITLSSNVAGIYRYYVRNYKEEHGNTGELTNSSAVVQIYGAAGLFQTITVPTVGQGDYWDVCAFDGASGDLTVVNRIVASPPESGSVGECNTNDQPQYVWDFGDGTTSNLREPTHVYAREGNYEVTLQLILPGGRTATINKPGFISVVGSAPEMPRLSIVRDSGGIWVTWQTADAAFILENCASLTSGSWSAVLPAPISDAQGNYAARFPYSGEQYFRLKK